MKPKHKNPSKGGRYQKASPDAEPVLVSRTAPAPERREKKAPEAVTKPKAETQKKDGGDKQ